MCLAIPAEITELTEGDMAIIDVGGVSKEICLALVEGAKVGDYVIVHTGFALSLLDPEEAKRTLELFAEINQAESPEAPA